MATDTLAHLDQIGIHEQTCQHSCDTIVIDDKGTPREVHAAQILAADRTRRAEDIQVLLKD